jgi:hypothetical protein
MDERHRVLVRGHYELAATIVFGGIVPCSSWSARRGAARRGARARLGRGRHRVNFAGPARRSRSPGQALDLGGLKFVVEAVERTL